PVGSSHAYGSAIFSACEWGRQAGRVPPQADWLAPAKVTRLTTLLNICMIIRIMTIIGMIDVHDSAGTLVPARPLKYHAGPGWHSGPPCPGSAGAEVSADLRHDGRGRAQGRRNCPVGMGDDRFHRRRSWD